MSPFVNFDQFIGTTQWFRFNAAMPNVLLTDGAQCVAESFGAYWLMDIIASVQPWELMTANWFQVWHLLVHDDKSATVWADDGNDNKLYTQEVPFTDFPQPIFKLYATHEDDFTVIMLPSEY